MLSDKLKECREMCDFSQQQVAECLNIDRSTYSYYESGRTEPSVENIKKLARLFGVSLCYLLESVPSSDNMPDQYNVLNDGSADDGALQEYAFISNEKLDARVGRKVGELSRDEQSLIMRYRMLTDKQRKDLMFSICLIDTDKTE